MTSIQTPEMKISMKEIVRIYQAVNDCRGMTSEYGDKDISEDFKKLSKKLTKFMYDIDQIDQEKSEFTSETFKLHNSK